jgi:hypothetical protein
MTVRVKEGSNEALVEVVANLREDDVREFTSISQCESREAMCADLIRRYADRNDTFAAFDNGTAVAFGAMVRTRPDVISAGFFATDAFNRVALPVARFVKRTLLPAYAEQQFRIECVVMESYEQAVRFVRLLGFRENEQLPGFGKRGENFIRFVWGG